MIVINNMKISVDVRQILDRIRELTNGEYLSDIKDNKNGSIMITCPFHGEHNERHPSCGIISDKNSEKEGVYHCFTCGEKGPLWKLVSTCLNMNRGQAEDWLTDNFADVFIENAPYISEIIKEDSSPKYLDENILNRFEYDNDRALWYLTKKRGLKKEVIDYFKIGYNKEKDTITFPVRDERGGLVGIGERSVTGKIYNLPAIKDKPVYLLDTAIKMSYTHVYVCESQINALDLYSNGIPAIALFGTGSKHQYEVLKRSGIRHYTLCFDGDKAGRSGRKRFYNEMNKDCIIDYIELPEGEDVNSMRKEDFFKLNILPLDNLYDKMYTIQRNI